MVPLATLLLPFASLPPAASMRACHALRFDATGYDPPTEPEPPTRRMSDRDERVALTLMVVVLLMLLFLPLSRGMLVDMMRYLNR